MPREGRHAERGVGPLPASEGHADYHAETSPSPEEHTFAAEPALVTLLDHVSNLDEAWFTRHRDRAFRVRRMIPGKHVDLICRLDMLALILVKEIRPGLQLRAPLWAPHWPCSCKECLGQLWEGITPAGFREALLHAAGPIVRGGRA